MNRIIILLLGAIFLNLLVLDWQVFSIKKESQVNPVSVIQPAPSQSVEWTCPQDCLDIIKAATSSLTPQLTKETIVKETIKTAPSAKEFYIPINVSGSTKSTDFVDVTGTEVYVSADNYPVGSKATFEAILRVKDAQGKAFARLYNVSDKAVVWTSEVSVTSTDKPTRTESAKFSLISGNKLYRVQLKTLIGGWEAILDSAKIKVVVE